MKFDSYSRFLKSGLYQECLDRENKGETLQFDASQDLDRNLRIRPLTTPSDNNVRDSSRDVHNFHMTRVLQDLNTQFRDKMVVKPSHVNVGSASTELKELLHSTNVRVGSTRPRVTRREGTSDGKLGRKFGSKEDLELDKSLGKVTLRSKLCKSNSYRNSVGVSGVSDSVSRTSSGSHRASTSLVLGSGTTYDHLGLPIVDDELSQRLVASNISRHNKISTAPTSSSSLDNLLVVQNGKGSQISTPSPFRRFFSYRRKDWKWPHRTNVSYNSPTAVSIHSPSKRNSVQNPMLPLTDYFRREQTVPSIPRVRKVSPCPYLSTHRREMGGESKESKKTYDVGQLPDILL